jgi:hypothetical protein
MNTILWAAMLLAPQEEFPFPVYEHDPWGGFGAGSSVTRLTVTGKIRSEETITVKAVDKDSETLTVTRPGKDDEEGAVKFVAFTDSLVAAGSGFQAGGKSNKQVAIGDKRVKALVREFVPTQLALKVWRITSTSEMPGGIFEISWKGEDDVTKSDVSYAMKGMETLKVGGVAVECAKIDMTATETKKKKRKVEATYWISEKVPGFLVRSRIKDTLDKVTTESAMDVVKFEFKKP